MTKVFGLVLLLTAFVIEVATWVFIRPFFAMGLFVGLGIPGLPLAALVLAVLLWPAISLVMTLLGLPGTTSMRWSVGARRPSQREKAILDHAMDRLVEQGAHRRAVFVVDSPMRNAFVMGGIVYVASGLVHDGYLRAALAHELGHINTFDGRINLALERLVFPGFRNVIFWLDMKGRFIMKFFLMILSGGYGHRLWPLSGLWRWHWRYGEYRADAYAARLGEATGLAETLDAYARPLDNASPYCLGRTHPYAEKRIDRLQRRRLAA